MKEQEDFRKFYQSQHPFNMSVFDSYTKHEINNLPKDYQSPTILEEHEMHVTQMDVFSRLMANRAIFFGSEVTSETSNIVVAQLLYLNSVNNDPITMYVNSPGGSVYDGYGILNTMQFVDSPVETINTGMAASMGAMILMCGTRGKRSSLELARTMIHQPLGGCKGQATEIEIEANEIKKLRNELYEIIAQRSGQPLSKIRKDAERDYWLTAKEAKEYGLIDNVIGIKWD